MVLSPPIVALLLVVLVTVALLIQFDVPLFSTRSFSTFCVVGFVTATIYVQGDRPRILEWKGWPGAAFAAAMGGIAVAEPASAAGGAAQAANAAPLGAIGWQPGAFVGVASGQTEEGKRVSRRDFTRLAHTMAMTIQPEGQARSSRFKDCAACPEMVFVEPGDVLIGATWDDGLATPAEKPARSVRIRHGFALSRVEVSMAELAEAGIVPRPPTACALSAGTSAHAPATCIGRAEISQYLRWIRLETGKKYRLPTAAEWEFAARTAALRDGGPEAMSGGAAEVVADCWQASLPDAATAREVYYDNGRDCLNSVVKDGADDEDDRWKRPSARRSVGLNVASPRIGFRVLRDVGPAETQQF